MSTGSSWMRDRPWSLRKARNRPQKRRASVWVAPGEVLLHISCCAEEKTANFFIGKIASAMRNESKEPQHLTACASFFIACSNEQSGAETETQSFSGRYERGTGKTRLRWYGSVVLCMCIVFYSQRLISYHGRTYIFLRGFIYTNQELMCVCVCEFVRTLLTCVVLIWTVMYAHELLCVCVYARALFAHKLLCVCVWPLSPPSTKL